MIKSFIVDSTCNEMRLDRWLRNILGKIPQGLLEKNLRLGKIKVNNGTDFWVGFIDLLWDLSSKMS